MSTRERAGAWFRIRDPIQAAVMLEIHPEATVMELPPVVFQEGRPWCAGCAHATWRLVLVEGRWRCIFCAGEAVRIETFEDREHRA